MDGTYSIIPIGSGLLFTYLLSYFAIQLKIISKSSQRKFWNTLLFITFLTTASLGLFLALQVNYKFTIPAIDTWISFHVDFGIAMAFIAIIHISWHFGYYLKFFHPNRNHKSTEPEDERFEKPDNQFHTKNRPGDILPVLALGVTTIITQIVLLREFMAVFQGNELILGLILANWMLITGFGAWLGKASPKLNNPETFIFSSLLLLGLIPPALIFLLHYLKNIVFIPGSMPGLSGIFISTFLLLLPFCLLSGYSFSFYSFFISKKFRSNQISRVYTWESLGSLGGGILFSVVLVYFVQSMQILALLLIMNSILVVYLFRQKKKNPGKLFFAFISLLLALTIIILPTEKYLKHFLYRNQEIQYMKDTPYGNLVITKLGDQLNFYENNNLRFNTLNTISNEENVHYAMVQRPKSKQILVISGAISGLFPEIMKYDIKNIDYVELNPWLIKAELSLFPDLPLDSINIIIQDARKYLSKCSKKYDVILINLPPPANVQLNRYYTQEFFRELKAAINPQGIISLSLPSSPNYSGKEEKDLHGLIYHTLKTVFSNVIIIPGEKDYFLSSDGQLSLNIAELIAKNGIENQYVSEYYIDDALLKDRSTVISSKLEHYKQLNTDLNPLAYFKQITYRLSFEKQSVKTIFIFVLFTLLLAIIWLRTITAGMFAAGFSGASMEILLLFSFQILYGYVYLMTAIIITVFMAGIALGAHPGIFLNRKKSIRMFIKLEILLVLLSLIFPFLILLFKTISLHHIFEQFVFLIFTFAFSFLVGMLFSSASYLQAGKTAKASAKIYSSDLLGGAFGALLVSGFLLPTLGLWETAFLTASVCMLAAGFSWFKRKDFQ